MDLRKPAVADPLLRQLDLAGNTLLLTLTGNAEGTAPQGAALLAWPIGCLLQETRGRSAGPSAGRKPALRRTK